VKGHKALMSTGAEEWGTPWKLFDRLHEIFLFDLDAAASKENAKRPRFYTKEQDALRIDWKAENAVWLNPPYGRNMIVWIKKAHYEAQLLSVPIVCLVPARTDTKWFQLAAQHANTIIFLPGRLKFEGGGKGPAPFPSALIVFDDRYRRLRDFGLVWKVDV